MKTTSTCHVFDNHWSVPSDGKGSGKAHSLFSFYQLHVGPMFGMADVNFSGGHKASQQRYLIFLNGQGKWACCWEERSEEEEIESGTSPVIAVAIIPQGSSKHSR